ncbi:hypothetical protein BAE44_0015333, partial [Dichanthelium oligosanthes]
LHRCNCIPPRGRSRRSMCTHIYQEIKACMISLSEVRLKKVRRECNIVAHELAHLAKRTEHCAVWRANAQIVSESYSRTIVTVFLNQ